MVCLVLAACSGTQQPADGGNRADVVADPRVDAFADVPGSSSDTPANTGDASPEAAMLKTDPTITVALNLHGYTPAEPKRLVVRTAFDCSRKGVLELLDVGSGNVVFSTELACDGTVLGHDSAAWPGYYSRADLDSWREKGTWLARARFADLVSPTARLTVDESAYRPVIDLVARWFHTQRCGDRVGRPLADSHWHEACHLDDGWVVSDKDIAEFSTLAAQHIDARGGWHDAGDYGKYVLTQSLGVYALLYAYDKSHTFWDGVDRNANGTPDIIEEAAWGADFLMKLVTHDTSGGVDGMWEAVGSLLYPRNSCLNLRAIQCPPFDPARHTNNQVVSSLVTSADGKPDSYFYNCVNYFPPSSSSEAGCPSNVTGVAAQACNSCTNPDDRLIDRFKYIYSYDSNGAPIGVRAARFRAPLMTTAAGLARLARYHRDRGGCADGSVCARYLREATGLFALSRPTTTDPSFLKNGDDAFRLATWAWALIAAIDLGQMQSGSYAADARACVDVLLDHGLAQAQGSVSGWIADPAGGADTSPLLEDHYYGVIPAALALFAQKDQTYRSSAIKGYLERFFGTFMTAASDNPFKYPRRYGRIKADKPPSFFWFSPRDKDFGSGAGNGHNPGIFELAWAAQLGGEVLQGTASGTASLALARHWIHWVLGRNPVELSLVNPGISSIATLPSFHTRLAWVPAAAATHHAAPGSIAIGISRPPCKGAAGGCPASEDRPYLDLVPLAGPPADPSGLPEAMTTEPWIATNAYALLALSEGEW